TFVGMCTWHPFLKDAVQKAEQAKLDRLVILPLFPHYSVTTTGSGFGALHELIDHRPSFQKLNVQWVRSWQDQPTYIESFVEGIQRELAKFGNTEKVHILFSAHSIPE